MCPFYAYPKDLIVMDSGTWLVRMIDEINNHDWLIFCVAIGVRVPIRVCRMFPNWSTRAVTYSLLFQADSSRWFVGSSNRYSRSSWQYHHHPTNPTTQRPNQRTYELTNSRTYELLLLFYLLTHYSHSETKKNITGETEQRERRWIVGGWMSGRWMMDNK